MNLASFVLLQVDLRCVAGLSSTGSRTAADQDSPRVQACTYTKPVKRRGPRAGYSILARQSSEQMELLRLLLGVFSVSLL
jgi:hypothetical protein